MNLFIKFYHVSLILVITLYSIEASEQSLEEDFQKSLKQGTREYVEQSAREVLKRLTGEKYLEPIKEVNDLLAKQLEDVSPKNQDAQPSPQATTNIEKEEDLSETVLVADHKKSKWNDYCANFLLPLGISNNTLNFLDNLCSENKYEIAKQVITLYEALNNNINAFNEVRTFLDMVIYPFRPEIGWLEVCAAVNAKKKELFSFTWKGEYDDQPYSIHNIISSKFPSDTPEELIKTYKLFIHINSLTITSTYAEICEITKKYQDLTEEMHPYWSELNKSEKTYAQGKEERLEEIKRREAEKTKRLQQHINEAKQFVLLKETLEESQKKLSASETQVQIMQAEVLSAQQEIMELKSSLQISEKEKLALQKQVEESNNQLQTVTKETNSVKEKLKEHEDWFTGLS